MGRFQNHSTDRAYRAVWHLCHEPERSGHRQPCRFVHMLPTMSQRVRHEIAVWKEQTPYVRVVWVIAMLYFTGVAVQVIFLAAGMVGLAIGASWVR
jgi:hypothetical protein